jgi:hypothetical protein
MPPSRENFSAESQSGQSQPDNQRMRVPLMRQALIIASLACAAAPLRLSASCAPPPPPCEAVAKADLVFIADVLDATSVTRRDDQGRPFPDGITNYRFTVLESLKGIETGEFRAQFYFGAARDDDSFASGRRYLILANRDAFGVYRSGCSLTREIKKVGEAEWLPSLWTEFQLCLKKP